MENIAEVGEEVVYNGDMSFASDDATFGLMNEYLICQQLYIVEGTCNYAGSNEMHYRIRTGRSSPLTFPCKSFTRDYRRYITNKYNLK